jgi:MarR family transcriptional regulator, organic hydroperoxide resistance regulator
MSAAGKGRGARLPTAGGMLIAKVHRVSGRVFARLLRQQGIFPINPAQGRILYVLWRRGSLSVKELSGETSLGPSTLTSMLDRLEKAGLLRRVPSLKDRRVVLVERTEADRALEERYGEVSARMAALTYGDMEDAGIAAFEAALAKVLANLEKAERDLKG